MLLTNLSGGRDAAADRSFHRPRPLSRRSVAAMTITQLILLAMAVVVLYWGVRILLGRR
jgi:hypothetical protein